MKYRYAISIPCLLALACLFTVSARAEDVSIAEYKNQLHEIEQKVDDLTTNPDQAGKLVTETPDTVSVTSSSGAISVSFKTLKDDLAAFSSADEAKRASLLPQIQSYVQALTAAAESYEQSGTDVSAAQGKLNSILARREFNRVRGPSAKDAFLARIYRWLARILNRLGSSRASFDATRLIIYLLVAAAAILILIWTIRRLRRPQEEPSHREIIPFAPSAKSWRAWLAEARALAQQQDWRNAIHLAYWAGISYLEEHGAWKPNRARTPREYLRLIGTRAAQYSVLAALTRKLEYVWYGYGEAAESDFNETLGQLENLGCR